MIENLKTFIDVARSGTFSAVAKERDLAVSSVTRQIDLLEAELGVALFQRSSRRLLLTDAGALFLPRATDIVAQMQDAKATLLDAQAEPSGSLTVTAPSAFGRRHIAPAAFSFLDRYPRIELDLHFSDEWVDLDRTRVDIAVRIGVLPSSDLTATALAPVHRVLCASPAYLARQGTPARPEDLLGHRCLTVSKDSPTPGGWWTFEDTGHRPLAVEGPIRSDDTETLLSAAIHGLGIVHLATWLVAEPLASGELVHLMPDAQPASGEVAEIHAARLKGRSHAARSGLFITHLKETFGSPPYWDAWPAR